MLFIPSTWIHAVRALDISISTNVFFRHQDPALFPKRDVFGNNDLTPFKRAEEETERALNGLNVMRDDQRRFYIKKLAMQMLEVADKA